MCLNGTYPFLSATLVRQLPYYLFRETCFMDSYPRGVLFFAAHGTVKKQRRRCREGESMDVIRYRHSPAGTDALLSKGIKGTGIPSKGIPVLLLSGHHRACIARISGVPRFGKRRLHLQTV